MTDYTNVSARALLATLSISIWHAQKFDKAVSREVTDRKDADRSAGRFNKHLFGTRRAGRQMTPEFFAVVEAGEKLRKIHNQHTLPWGKKDGERLLPTANYMVYTDAIRAAGNEFYEARDTFLGLLPEMKAKARENLGALWKDEDFPTARKIKGKFGYTVHFDPLPSAGDVRCDLPADRISEIEASVAQRMEATARVAMTDAWARLHYAVERIKRAAGTTEKGRKSPVYDGLIGHAREVCDVLTRLNVSQDADLEALRARVLADLTDVAEEDLRTDDAVRAETARKAESIMDAMSAFYAPAEEAEEAA